MNTPQTPPAIGTLKALLDQSRYAESATDPARHQARLAKYLSEHRDPVWREIGRQLRDGHMSIRDTVSVEAYRKVFYDGIDNNRETFVSSLHAAAKHLEQNKQSAADSGTTPPHRSSDKTL